MFTLEADGKANTRISLLVVSLIIVCLTTLAWLHHGVYERLYNDVLEGSFILNLCLFTMATFYVEGYAAPSCDCIHFNWNSFCYLCMHCALSCFYNSSQYIHVEEIYTKDEAFSSIRMHVTEAKNNVVNQRIVIQMYESRP